MAKKKTWLDKLKEQRTPHVKRIDTDFADMPAGSTMLIATPSIIEDYILQIGYGKHIDTKTLRKDLALAYNAEYTCPVTTGIFLRIVAEANYERFQQGHSIEDIAPFWRVIQPNSPLAKKLTCGQAFIAQQIAAEGD